MTPANIPNLFRINLEAVTYLKNWPRVVRFRGRNNSRAGRLEFRNGVMLQGAPPEVLDWLFREIWIHRVYTLGGFEIRPGDTVIDVGANIGAFAMYAATCAPDVKVYSFEPLASNAAWLRKNVEASGLSNVHIFQQAVAGAAGERRLFINPNNCMFHSLFFDQKTDEDAPPSQTVACTTLDEIFQANQIDRCQLLKLDCEGAELEILENSSRATLQRVDKIAGELHGKDAADTLRHILESHSFTFEIVAPKIFRATNRSLDQLPGRTSAVATPQKG